MKEMIEAGSVTLKVRYAGNPPHWGVNFNVIPDGRERVARCTGRTWVGEDDPHYWPGWWATTSKVVPVEEAQPGDGFVRGGRWYVIERVDR